MFQDGEIVRIDGREWVLNIPFTLTRSPTRGGGGPMIMAECGGQTAYFTAADVLQGQTLYRAEPLQETLVYSSYAEAEDAETPVTANQAFKSWVLHDMEMWHACVKDQSVWAACRELAIKYGTPKARINSLATTLHRAIRDLEN